MTLNETWKNCLSMWRWIAKIIKAGDKRSVIDLKEEWCEKHGFVGIRNDCFFCHFKGPDSRAARIPCYEARPAALIDSDFNCWDGEYHYKRKPINFYNKLVSLNRKRIQKGRKG